MIIKIDADIFDTDVTGAQAIIHQCNCFHTMGAGIARNIRERFPEAYEADLKTSFGSPAKLGKSLPVPILKERYVNYPNLLYIINLYSQFNYGRQERQTSYDALFIGLKNIHDWAEAKKLRCVSVPQKMGCNLAGGDWTIVSAILESIFKDSKLIMMICSNPALKK